jgi:hypothetical protein
MCASCFNHLLADCKLKDEQTTWYVDKRNTKFKEIVFVFFLVQIVVVKSQN